MWSSVQSSPRSVHPVANRHHQNHASSSASPYAAAWLLGRGESRRVVARQLNGIICCVSVTRCRCSCCWKSVFEFIDLRRGDRSIRENKSSGLSPLRQMDSTCRLCNDYVLFSVNESINFRAWGSELGDYDISSSNTSLLHYKFTLRVLGGNGG